MPVVVGRLVVIDSNFLCNLSILFAPYFQLFQNCQSFFWNSLISIFLCFTFLLMPIASSMPVFVKSNNSRKNI